MIERKIIFVDMDGVLCDFMKDYNKLISKDNPYPQSRINFFKNLEPYSDAVASYRELEEHFDVWILTRPSVLNPLCYMEKRMWVEDHLGIETCHKLIISSDKSLLRGDYLIDDMPRDNIGNVLNFQGEHIHFGTESAPNWEAVLNYLINKV